MLKEIEIQNFRCFEQIKISGFERVNLIGGKNNAGKTTLLEALFLNVVPKPSSILFLRELRKESSLVMKAMPDKAWDNLFHVRENKYILITVKDENNDTSIRIEPCIDPTTIYRKNIDPTTIDPTTIRLSIGSTNKLNKLSFSTTGTMNTLIAGSKGLINGSNTIITDAIPTPGEVPIIPSFTRISGIELTAAYDRARLNEKDSEVLKAFQVIDPAIESVESFYIGEPTLYLRRKGEKRLPLSLFGDALNRVAEIILKLVNSEHKILLIDEIENGIHHTNQKEFWRMLFRLAVEVDTQIFATTHSLEMLQAFADVGLELNKECSSAYFELARKLKTNQIIGSRLDLETLNYALEHKEGVRGE
ncbi:ATP/GTP-binding protein [Tychonema sp. BBK16]|uniref:AAA family ATPase n=1 Tax=Tychonema sp. BBK16 TaxID=2699888 RepID=UPI001F4645B2|nr:ATP-binding protein [Tychonema sp. BBK16]MCF6374086.1 AAA family ATPase [Tychonema sp. BBK16]